jgi:hypothetical protein
LLEPVALSTVAIVLPVGAQPPSRGLRRDPEAIADTKAMVEAMGGKAIWSELRSIHVPASCRVEGVVWWR